MGQLQRIQSVYLFLASLMGGSLFGLPLATAPKTQEGLLMDGLLNVHDNIGLLILVIVVSLLSLVTIFLYNNRVLQMNLGKLNLLLILVLVAFAGYLFSTVQAVATIGGGLVTPVVAFVLTILANKSIQKDEKLVRDSDRLR